MLLKFSTEKEWLEARKQDVTSTEVAALFGLHPYKSRLQLWQEKSGILELDYVESDPMKWGKRLQIPVAMGICEDEGWKGEDLTGLYARDPERRLGASFDVKATCRDEGVGILETKIAESFDESQGWFKDKAPIHYEFQVQTQLHLLKKDDPEIKWLRIGTLGRRQKVRLYMRRYDVELGALIDNEVVEFWESVAAGIPPAPDYTVDGPLLERLRKPLRAGDTINLSTNNRAVELSTTYDEISEEIRPLKVQYEALEKTRAAIRAELHSIIGRNERAIIGPYTIGAREQVVEPFLNNGSAWRRFDFNKKKGK